MEVDAHGEVAWANPNGQSGVRVIALPPAQLEALNVWLLANSPEAQPEEAEPVSFCKLTDLSLGGCYIETESPFPEQALIDLCLKAAGMEIHADGMVRVMHPGSGMGVEFPSRTSEQRQTVASFIDFLTSRPGTMPELVISQAPSLTRPSFITPMHPQKVIPLKSTWMMRSWNCCVPANHSAATNSWLNSIANVLGTSPLVLARGEFPGSQLKQHTSVLRAFREAFAISFFG
jgi:hypothetical protein